VLINSGNRNHQDAWVIKQIIPRVFMGLWRRFLFLIDNLKSLDQSMCEIYV